MVMFRCDAPSPDSEGAKDGTAARSGLLVVDEMLLGVTLEELAADYAERVVDAYMRRHAPEAWAAGDGQRIARVHNGGPRGHEKEATVGYWRRVRSRLPAPR